MRVDWERTEQLQFTLWAREQSWVWFHVPNERSEARQAARLSQVGVVSGVPDIFICVPAWGLSGLFIEMKAPKPHRGRVSSAQKAFLETVCDDYGACVCWGFESAKVAVSWYLEGQLLLGEVNYIEVTDNAANLY